VAVAMWEVLLEQRVWEGCADLFVAAVSPAELFCVAAVCTALVVALSLLGDVVACMGSVGAGRELCIRQGGRSNLRVLLCFQSLGGNPFGHQLYKG